MLADRMRIKRRNPYTPSALAAVAFFGGGQAFRLYDTDTLLEYTDGVPTLAHSGLYAAFQPGGAHLAVLYLDTTVKLVVYDTSDWSVAANPVFPSTSFEVGHISWSASGRFLCAFADNEYLLLDAEDEWSSVAIDATFSPSVSGGRPTYTSCFVGDAMLIVCEGIEGQISFYDITATVPVTTTFSDAVTSIDGHTIVRAGYAAAARPAALTSVPASLIALMVSTEDAAVFRTRFFANAVDGITTPAYSEELGASDMSAASLVYASDSSQILYKYSRADSDIGRRDPNAAGYADLGSMSISGMVGWAHTDSSILVFRNNGSGSFVLNKYNGTTAVLEGSRVVGVADGELPESISTNDWPINMNLPPIEPS